jgi:hypothetical protein
MRQPALSRSSIIHSSDQTEAPPKSKRSLNDVVHLLILHAADPRQNGGLESEENPADAGIMLKFRSGITWVGQFYPRDEITFSLSSLLLRKR